MDGTDTRQVFRAGSRSPNAPPGTLRRYVPFKLSTPVNMPMWIDVTSGNNGSVRALTQNDFRASLTLQNLSTSYILYFGWGNQIDASTGLALGPGKGIIFDVICPQAAVYLFMDSPAGSPQQCQVMEISYE